MQSPTHSLIALAILAKRENPKQNWAILLGSIVPDAFIYVCWVWLTFIKGHSQSEIWRDIYFNDPMQLTGAIFNSAPIYIGLALLGFWQRKKTWGKLLLFFALAALIHLAMDLPVHADDAHRHFWPLSNWRYYSPLSYWDNDHNAQWVGLVEAIIASIAIFVLWRRFPKVWVRVVLGLFTLFYIGNQFLIWLAPWSS